MPEKQAHNQQVAALIAQDREINDIKIEDFRMKLEVSRRSRFWGCSRSCRCKPFRPSARM
jgi:hypothetical protein